MIPILWPMFERTLNCLTILASLFILLSCSQAKTKSPIKPNILLILSDDQGYGDLAIHGNEYLETPHLDRLAGESIIFDRFYVSPVCAPTRASLLTGRYHIATGTTWVTHRMEVMREEEVTLAEMLKPAGYRSGLFGKWHQGKQFPHDPIGQGFDDFFGFTEGHLNNYFDTQVMEGFKEVRTQGYLPDVLTDRIIDFMDKEDRFFAILSLNTPHSPFQVPDQYFDKYKAKGLNDKDACVYGMVENIDENVGRVVAYLEESGKIDNTIVIFMTDNGPNGVRFNDNMKGIKGHLDEGGVRVPFFMKIPGYPPQTIEAWAGHVDLFPTLADLLEISLPTENEIHGRSLLPLIHEDPNWEDRYFFTHHVNRTFDTIPGAIRNQQYVLTLRQNRKELYDLIQDPSQQDNIIERHEELANGLEKQYMAWLVEMTEAGVEPPLIQVGHENVPVVELPAPDGKRLGNVVFKGEMGWANDWFVKFKNQKDQVYWELEVVDDATYEVFVQVANDSPVGLELTYNGQGQKIKLSDIHQAKMIPNQDRVPRSEVEEMQWPLVSLGEIVFGKGNGKISLAPVDLYQGNLEVKSLMLKKL